MHVILMRLARELVVQATWDLWMHPYYAWPENMLASRSSRIMQNFYR